MKLIDKFKMTRDDFNFEFNKIYLVKLCTKPSQTLTDAYWDALEDCPMLEEALRETRNRSYYRDFNRLVPRIPQSSEIREITHRLWKSKLNEIAKIERERESEEREKNR